MNAGIETVPWLFHDDGIVESIDVDPTGLRISSAGDTWVCIWDARHLTSPTQSEPLLGALNFCPRFITVAKWDPSGSQLAFAGEAGFISVIRRNSGPGIIIFEDGSSPSLENWQQVGCFLGHSSDVMDLSWHSTDKLATASLDNTILVWSVQTQQRLRRFEGHRSFVKALSWDPKGHYLASISDDRSLIVWNVDSAKIEATIKEPFLDNPVSSFSGLKIDWAPNGSKLLAVNVGKTQEAQLIAVVSRSSWTREYRGICGHGVLTIAKFNPHEFTKGQSQYHYWATGGTTGLVSVWCEELAIDDEGVTNKAAPPETIEVSNAITDLTWGPDAYTLLIATTTGQIFRWSLPKWLLGEKTKERSIPAPVHGLVKVQSSVRTPRKTGVRRICPERMEVGPKEDSSDEGLPREYHQHRFLIGERKLGFFRVPVKSRRSDRYSVEVHNWQEGNDLFSFVTFEEAKYLIWSLKLDFKILMAVANNDYLSFISEDCYLLVTDLKSGSSLMKSNIMNNVWCMDCDDNETLIVITKDWCATIWNLKTLTSKKTVKIPARETRHKQNPVQDVRLISAQEIEIRRTSTAQKYFIITKQLINVTLKEISDDSPIFPDWEISRLRRASDFTAEERTQAFIPSNVFILESKICDSKVRGNRPEVHIGILKLLYLLLRLYSAQRRWIGRKILFLCKQVKHDFAFNEAEFVRIFRSELLSLMGQDEERYLFLVSDTMFIFDSRV
eukprot:g2847.t1